MNATTSQRDFLDAQPLDHFTNDLAIGFNGFLPEIIVCIALVLMLLYRLLKGTGRTQMGGMALAFTLLALFVSALQWIGSAKIGGVEVEFVRVEHAETGIFTGLLAFDHFSVFLRLFLYGFTALVIILTMITGIPERRDSADFHILLLGSVVGMSIMASANHLLMVFIGVEMASLPSYALAGFLKNKRQSSEASLKYVVYGGGAAGIMLYGITLLMGRFGTGYMPQVGFGLTMALSGEGGLVFDPLLYLGLLFIFVGIAFKLSAFPFHFWCPDVFEGATAEVAGFLSVASKGAGLALLVRVTSLFGTIPLADFFVPMLAVFAILTATFGNLAAYRQTNLKRLLAYSTIAHAGYMLMGLATLTPQGSKAVLFYLVAYVFMNLGAFAVVAFLRQNLGSEDLKDCRGLVRRAPWLVVLFAIFLLSLLGVPPLVGFVAKFQVFAALFESANAYGDTGHDFLSTTLFVTLVFGAINTVISAVYYLKVLKVMILESTLEEIEQTEPEPVRVPKPQLGFGGILGVAVVVFGLWWGFLDKATQAGVAHLHRLHDDRTGASMRPVNRGLPGEGLPPAGPPRGPMRGPGRPPIGGRAPGGVQ